MSEAIEEKPKPTLDPKRGLVIKLCEIMAAVGYLQKKGNNEKQSYKYIREADVVAKMRDEFASRNIFIFPSLVHHENVKMVKTAYDKTTENYQTNIVMRWTIVDGDTGQERVCEIPGSSASPGDKGVYVAMTGSEKYLLMKGFLLPTGDDPEDDANEEKESKAKKFVEDEVERQKKGKAPRSVPVNANELLYTFPVSHNGHFAEFLNIRPYIAAHLDEEDSLRMAFTAHGGKKTKDETAMVPAEKMPHLLEVLAGDMGIAVHELKAAQ